MTDAGWVNEPQLTPARYSSTTDGPYLPDPPPDTQPGRSLVQVGGSRLEWMEACNA